MNTKKLSFTVKRSKWRCGGDGPNKLGKGPTFLLNSLEYQCCLGFACRDLGYKGRMVFKNSPQNLNTAVDKLVTKDGPHIRNTDFSDMTMIINDAYDTTVKQKEKELIQLGKEHNIDIKFID